jgi:hypothetical protein
MKSMLDFFGIKNSSSQRELRIMDEMDFLKRTNLLKSQAIALSIEKVKDLKFKRSNRTKKAAVAELLRMFAAFVRPYIAAMTMRGLFPETIGRYRVLDVLLIWEEWPRR